MEVVYATDHGSSGKRVMCLIGGPAEIGQAVAYFLPRGKSWSHGWHIGGVPHYRDFEDDFPDIQKHRVHIIWR